MSMSDFRWKKKQTIYLIHWLSLRGNTAANSYIPTYITITDYTRVQYKKTFQLQYFFSLSFYGHKDPATASAIMQLKEYWKTRIIQWIHKSWRNVLNPIKECRNHFHLFTLDIEDPLCKDKPALKTNIFCNELMKLLMYT